MSKASVRPQYAAALFQSDELKVELTPISLADASNDDDAHEFAMDRAGKWMIANGVYRATLKIVRDGVGFPSKHIEGYK